jgi:hypothetical protein
VQSWVGVARIRKCMSLPPLPSQLILSHTVPGYQVSWHAHNASFHSTDGSC